MKNRVTIILACSLLFGGIAYGCSSPPAHAPTGVNKTGCITNHLPMTMPIALTVVQEYDLAVASATNVYNQTATIVTTIGTVKGLTVSMATFGHAIDQRVATGLKLNYTKIAGTSSTIEHIDPGLQTLVAKK